MKGFCNNCVTQSFCNKTGCARDKDCDPTKVNWDDEKQRCEESLYYFMTNYCVVEGKRFATDLSEKEFNKKYQI